MTSVNLEILAAMAELVFGNLVSAQRSTHVRAGAGGKVLE